VFRIGVLGFVTASIACALAPDPGVLIGARAVQGAMAALAIPQTFGLIRAMFAGGETARALGTIGPVMGLAAVCGPVLGGVLTQADLFGSSWRAVFLVNVPLGVAVLAVSPLLREDRSPHRPRLDPIGTVLAAAGTGLITYPLINADTDGFPVRTWLSIVAGVLLLIGFAAHQGHRARRGRTPLVEPTLFADRGFAAALVTSTLFFAVMTGLSLVVVLQLQIGQHANAQVAGLSLLPWSLGLAAASVLAGGLLVPRYGARVMYAGLLILLIGVICGAAVYRTVGSASYPWPLIGALAVSGIGLGLFTVPFFTAALAQVRPTETGSATGLLNAVQQLGGTLGVALLGTVFFRTVEGASALTAVSALHGAARAFEIAAAMVVVTGIATIVMVERGRHRTRDRTPSDRSERMPAPNRYRSVAIDRQVGDRAGVPTARATVDNDGN
jgi:MFS family permease